MSDWDDIFTSFGRMFDSASASSPLAREWARTAQMLRKQGHHAAANQANRTALALLPRRGAA